MENTGVEGEDNPYDILEVDQVLESHSKRFRRRESDQEFSPALEQSNRRKKAKQTGGFREEMAPRGTNVIDEFVAVEELHALSPKDMSSLLQEEESLVLKLSSAKGVILTVDVEKLASCLPLHLMACVASSSNEPRLRYWLRSVRLLHTLSSLAHGYPKLAQVLLQDVKIRMQILDLVTYMLVVLANMEQVTIYLIFHLMSIC